MVAAFFLAQSLLQPNISWDFEFKQRLVWLLYFIENLKLVNWLRKIFFQNGLFTSSTVTGSDFSVSRIETLVGRKMS